MKTAQRSTWTSLVITITLMSLSAACSSSGSSVKQLDESSARDLIKDRLKKEPYKIRVENISKLLVRTLKNYKSSNPANDQEATVKRLLDRGLVLQTVETLSYPKISGTFQYQDDYYNRPGNSFYALEMLPNSNVLTGEIYRTSSPESAEKTESLGKVEGSVEPDGRIRLTGSNIFPGNGAYVEEGSAALLDIQHDPPFPRERYKGKATGKKVDVKWYGYSWSPDFQKQLTGAGDMIYVIGGDLEIGNVTNLRLVTDTEATAKFSWGTSLNDVGKLFFPNQPPSGESNVAFGKKPDGTWFVDHLRMNDRDLAR